MARLRQFDLIDSSVCELSTSLQNCFRYVEQAVMIRFLTVVAFALSMVGSSVASAGIINFDLQGKAGFGLLSGNENGLIVGTPGTGGEIGGGIVFDDVTKVLSIDVGWGSIAGFTGSLTGPATAMHIHGPAVFTANAGVLIGLSALAGFDSSANGGGFNGTVVLNAINESRLMAGLLYINVHTATNPGGELRANLVAVPEPSSFVLLATALSGIVFFRRR